MKIINGLNSFFRLTWCLIYTLVLVSLGGNIIAQTKPAPDGKSGSGQISIHSENNQIIDATFEPATQYLNGDVKVYHAGTFMYCDTAILKGSNLNMRHNVVLLQHDSIRIFADSMQYYGDSLVAYLYGNIILINGPEKTMYTTFLRYDVKNKIAYYNKNARLVDGNSTLISKRGKYSLEEKTAFFYENVKATGDDFVLVSDSLYYKTEIQTAYFMAPVRIDKDSSQLYSEKGWFEMNSKKGDFMGNAQYLKGFTIARSDTISYDGSADVVILKSGTGRSEYISEKDTAFAQIIYFDQKNEVFRLTTDAWYKGEKNEVRGEKIYYDKKTEKFNVSGRSIVIDPPTIIEADSLDYDKSIKYGKADGHVIWRDTSAKTAIYADHVLYKGEINYMKATNDLGRPMFTTEIDGDTLFLRADTLRSFRIIKERITIPDKNAGRRAKNILSGKNIKSDELSESDLDTDNTALESDSMTMSDTVNTVMEEIARDNKDNLGKKTETDTIFTGIMDTIDYFVGVNHVRIFKSDLQAICDSLVFNKTDSVFTLYKQPFVWSDSSQIAGDSIDIKLKAKKVDKLIIRSDANILSTEDDIFYNQIQGNYIESFFEESKMYKMDVDGNCKIVYYLKDDQKAYTGVNITESSFMTFLLKDNKITDIRNYREPKSKVLPMKNTNHETIKVKGFLWNIKLRPLNRDDL